MEAAAMAVLQCPVCLDDIQETPIYVCENPQGHSVCSKCHTTLKKEKKPCPTCRQPLADRRSLGLEQLLEALLKKCSFKDCTFKATTKAAMEKHKEDWHRTVPCAHCDEKIGLKALEEHLEKEHDIMRFNYGGLSEVNHFWLGKNYSEWNMDQCVWVDEGGNGQSPQFVCNWLTTNKGAIMCWFSLLGPKADAKAYKYTVRVETSETSAEYLFECTRRCEPCDLSHEEVERDECAVVLPKKLIEEAAEGDDRNRFHFDITIQKA